jgi:hypothetical protein
MFDIIIAICAFSSLDGNKRIGKLKIGYSQQSSKEINKTLRNQILIPLSANACKDADGVAISTAPDGSGCNQAYVNAYKAIPADTDVKNIIKAYSLACATTTCKDGCYEKTVGAATSYTYIADDKPIFKSKCRPAGKAPGDICFEGDDTPITDQLDTDKCYDSYSKLIEKLPATASGKKNAKNQTFLEGELPFYTKFLEDCSKTICTKEGCYEAIAKKVPTVWDVALRTSITSKCTVTEPSKESSSIGVPGIRVHKTLALIWFALFSIQIWI